jgi:hypothetical protein
MIVAEDQVADVPEKRSISLIQKHQSWRPPPLEFQALDMIRSSQYRTAAILAGTDHVSVNLVLRCGGRQVRG